MIPRIIGYRVRKGLVKVKLLCNENIHVTMHMIPAELRYRLYMQEYTARHHIGEATACKIDDAVRIVQHENAGELKDAVRHYLKTIGMIVSDTYRVGTDDDEEDACPTCLVANDNDWKDRCKQHDVCQACAVVHKSGGKHEHRKCPGYHDTAAPAEDRDGPDRDPDHPDPGGGLTDVA